MKGINLIIMEIKPIVIKNKFIPFGNFESINLFGVVFTKSDNLSFRSLNHEFIHTMQYLECFGVGFLLVLGLCLLFGWSMWWLLISLPTFYYWYVIEWMIRGIMYSVLDDDWDCKKRSAYREMSFEKEAYNNDDNVSYIMERKPFAWLKEL